MRLCNALAADQGAVFARSTNRDAPRQPYPKARARHLAAAVLGASSARRAGSGDAYPLLLVEPGEARFCHPPRELAIFVISPGRGGETGWLVECVFTRTVFTCTTGVVGSAEMVRASIHPTLFHPLPNYFRPPDDRKTTNINHLLEKPHSSICQECTQKAPPATLKAPCFQEFPLFQTILLQ